MIWKGLMFPQQLLLMTPGDTESLPLPPAREHLHGPLGSHEDRQTGRRAGRQLSPLARAGPGSQTPSCPTTASLCNPGTSLNPSRLPHTGLIIAHLSPNYSITIIQHLLSPTHRGGTAALPEAPPPRPADLSEAFHRSRHS